MDDDQNVTLDLDSLAKARDAGLVSPETYALAEQKFGKPDQSVPIGEQTPDSAFQAADQMTPAQIAQVQSGAPATQASPSALDYATPYDPNAQPQPGAPADQNPTPATAAGGEDQSQRTPAAAPSSLVQPQKPTNQPQGTNPFEQEQSLINQGFDQQRQGLQGIQSANDQSAANSAKALDDTITQLNAVQAKWQQREADWHQTSQQYVDQMNNFVKQQVSAPGIDPHRYMNNLSTGGKIAAAISLVMGGIGGGLSGHGGNMALDILNRNIDRDIEAQKFNYERGQTNIRNQQSLYGMLRDQFGDERNADLAARSGMLEIAKLQLQKQSNQTQSQVAKANAQQMLGSLSIQQAQLNSQIYMNKFRMQAMNAAQGGQGVPGAALPAFSGDEMKRAVKLPNGNYGFSTNEDQAKETNKAALKYDQINATLNEMQNLKDQAGTSLPLSEARVKANSLGARLAPMLNEYYGINRLSDTDFKHVLEPQIPDSTSLFQGNAQTRIDTLRSALKKDHDLMLNHSVIGYSPVNFQTQERQ